MTAEQSYDSSEKSDRNPSGKSDADSEKGIFHAADTFARLVQDLKRKRDDGKTEPAKPSEPPIAGTVELQQRTGKRKKLTAPRNFGQAPPWLIAAPSINGVMIHKTHIPHLGWHRGLVWCWRCGRYATRIPLKLRDVCGGWTESGANHLGQLRQGKPPTGTTWPLKEER